MTSLKIADLQRDAYTEGREEGISIGIERGIERGMERGAYENKLETAKVLLSMGLSLEQVAQGTSLPLETVQELMKN